MRPPVLPRGRRGTSLSRMEGGRAALEEMQNGLGGYPLLTPSHLDMYFPKYPQLTTSPFVYLPTFSPSFHAGPPAVS